MTKGVEVFRPAQNDAVAVSQGAIILAARTGATALALWKDAPADFFLSADVKLTPGATLHLLLRSNPQAKQTI